MTDLFPGFDGSVDFCCKFFRCFSFMVKIGFFGLASCLHTCPNRLPPLPNLCIYLVLLFRTFSLFQSVYFSILFSIIKFMLIGVGYLYETSVGNTFGLV